MPKAVIIPAIRVERPAADAPRPPRTLAELSTALVNREGPYSRARDELRAVAGNGQKPAAGAPPTSREAVEARRARARARTVLAAVAARVKGKGL